MPARIATKMPAFTLDAEAPERKIWSIPSLGALALAATGSDWFSGIENGLYHKEVHAVHTDVVHHDARNHFITLHTAFKKPGTKPHSPCQHGAHKAGNPQQRPGNERTFHAD